MGEQKMACRSSVIAGGGAEKRGYGDNMATLRVYPPVGQDGGCRTTVLLVLKYICTSVCDIHVVSSRQRDGREACSGASAAGGTSARRQAAALLHTMP